MRAGQEKFLKICCEKGYFEQHEKVLVALSGGQDSMTLWNWLTVLQKKLGISELLAAHVNYGLRAEADEEEQELRKLVPNLQLAHFSGKFTEESGRDFRYQFFKEVMAKTGATALLTAHHKDDQAETLLMKLITGRRLRYLSGISDRQAFGNGELIRPLLQFEKSELDAKFYFEDVTNFENEHLRNRVRNLYLPSLRAENPQLTEALAALADETRAAFSVIHEQTAPFLGHKVELADFQQQSEALQSFVFQDYLAQFPDFQVSKAQFSELLQILKRPQQYRQAINKNFVFVKTHQEFYLIRQDREKGSELIVQTENPNDPSFLEINLPSADYQIRQRESADKIMFHGVHRKLKQFFIDEKISLENREISVIAMNQEIYALPSLGILSDLSKKLKNDKIVTTIWTKIKKESEQSCSNNP